VNVSLAAEDAPILVRCFGYFSLPTIIPEGAVEFVATLTPGCMLDCELSDSSSDVSELNVEISAPTPLFVGEGTKERDMSSTLAGSWTSTSRNGRSIFDSDAESPGRWRFAGLTPGQPIQIKLRGGGAILLELEVPPLSPGEVRKVELRLDVSSKDLSVRVLSSDGKPVKGATIDVVQDGDPSSNRETQIVDDNGVAIVRGLFGDRCRVLVLADGFAEKAIALAPIPTNTVDVVLDAPLSLEVQLVNLDGLPFVERVYWIAVGSETHRGPLATDLGSGRFRVDGLPSGLRSVRAVGQFGDVTQLHDTRVSPLRLVVGRKGYVQATLHGAVPQSSWAWALAVAAPGSMQDLTRSSFQFDAGEVGRAGIRSLAPGSYEVWLETCPPDAVDTWTRVGRAQNVVIDAEHESVKLELHAPL
jgi:hypothetical protein